MKKGSRVHQGGNDPARNCALLFVHGLGASASCFLPLVESLGRAGWESHRFDLPGYGEAAKPDPPLDFPGLVNSILEARRTMEAACVVLVGHSMGGVLAQLAVEAAPERFAGIVDVEGNLSRDDCTLSGFAARCSVDEFLTRRWRRLLRRLGLPTSGSGMPPEYLESLARCDPKAFHLHGCSLVEASFTEDLARRLKSLPVPHLYIAGRSRGISDRSIRLLEEAGADWVGIEGAGHWPFLEAPEAFHDILLGFLAGMGK